MNVNIKNDVFLLLDSLNKMYLIEEKCMNGCIDIGEYISFISFFEKLVLIKDIGIANSSLIEFGQLLKSSTVVLGERIIYDEKIDLLMFKLG